MGTCDNQRYGDMDKAGISVDCVATSEVSVSLTLDPAKVWSRDLVQEELDALLLCPGAMQAMLAQGIDPRQLAQRLRGAGGRAARSSTSIRRAVLLSLFSR